MLVGLLLSLFLNNPPGPFLGALFARIFGALRFAAPAFLLFTTTGYALSIVMRLPRTGRAYDCIHYFYNITASLGLLIFAAIVMPPQPQAREIGVSAFLGIAGIAWLLFAFISIVRRFERSESRT